MQWIVFIMHDTQLKAALSNAQHVTFLTGLWQYIYSYSTYETDMFPKPLSFRQTENISFCACFVIVSSCHFIDIKCDCLLAHNIIPTQNLFGNYQMNKSINL